MTGLNNLDLNLLVTLQILLEERSVTRAAARLGRSQSATSHALARLREMFDDPLLIRSRGEMLPTPRAEALAPQLEPLLEQLQRLVQTTGGFAPNTTKRRFSVACPDAIGGALTALLRWMQTEAPHAHLSIRRPPPAAIDKLESGALDLLVAAAAHVDTGDVLRRHLGTTRLVSYLRADHPLRDTAVTVEAWLQTPHVQVMTGDRGRNILGGQLAKQGLERRLGVEVPNFMMALATVAATDAMFTAPDVMADYAREVFAVVALEPPIPLPPIAVAMFWHRRWHRDEGHRWFRDGVGGALASLTRERGPGGV